MYITLKNMYFVNPRAMTRRKNKEIITRPIVAENRTLKSIKLIQIKAENAKTEAKNKSKNRRQRAV